MHGFVEKLERMAKYMDRDPTAEEVLEAMRDEHAARIDNAKDRAKEFGLEETK